MNKLVQRAAGRGLLCVILLLPLACSNTTPAKAPDFVKFPQPDTPPPTDIGALVYIPGGTFTMGAPDDAEDNPLSPRITWITPARPAHRETVQPFYIGKYQITAREYCEFLNEVVKEEPANGFRRVHRDIHGRRLFTEDAPSDGTRWVEPEEHGYVFLDFLATVLFEDGKYKPREGFELTPAMHVPYLGARRYCEWLSEKTGEKYRLPTEIEWEFAARGKEGRTFPWGEDSPFGKMYLAICDPQQHIWKPGVTYVGRFPQGATPEGVHDLVGNARQWCGNYYYDYLEKPIALDLEQYRLFAEPPIPKDEAQCWKDGSLTVSRGGQGVDAKRRAVANGWTRSSMGMPILVQCNGMSFRVAKECEK